MKKKKLKHLPEHIQTRARDLVNAMKEGEYKTGFMNGMKFLRDILEESEKEVDEMAVNRAILWFEEEIMPLHGPDEIYTEEYEEKHGIAYLSNVKDEWAHEFFARVEMEKEMLYANSEKTNLEREDIGEGK